jgi:hypothetical protein
MSNIFLFNSELIFYENKYIKQNNKNNSLYVCTERKREREREREIIIHILRNYTNIGCAK